MSQAIADDRLTLTASAPEALPAWLRERKRQDHATFAGLPMPDTTMEDWRRTDIGHVVLSELAPPEPGDDAPALDLAAAAQVRSGEGGALLLQAGGATHTVTVPEDLARQGVVVASLEAAATTHADLVRRCLDQEVVPAAAGKFAALNAAFWRGGVFVHVPRGVVAALPVWTAS
ncbi:MAG TPA: hypothetical protein VG245_04450, partial [Candidatus Dormibacteraeota bacterium]|nr:hypothetical protein [Candidatus Dormibacteraeota bacterium]